MGTWGDFTDARSRLSRRARTIERELRREHRTSTALWRRRLLQAARFAALAEKILETFGHDPAATPQRAAKLQGTSERLLRQVPLRTREPGDLAKQIQAAQRRRS